MRIWAIAVVVVLAVSACGDSATTTTAGPEPVTGATAGPPTTVTTTTAPPVTEAPPDTTQPAPATTVAGGDPVFTITQVTFGGNGFVEITNTGAGPGNLDGHWLCRRPNYFSLDPVELAPGQSVWIAAGSGDGLTLSAGSMVVAALALDGALGELTATSGEVALYLSPDFGNAAAIRDFVAWAEPSGLPGLGRADVAVEAGIWEAGGLVEVSPDSISISVIALPATGPEAWVADSGG